MRLESVGKGYLLARVLKRSAAERAKAREYMRRTRTIKRAYVLDYRKTHPCVDCGEADPVVLDFDHRLPHRKNSGVSELIAGGYQLEVLIYEINLCDMRCANCHRRKHHRERVAAL